MKFFERITSGFRLAAYLGRNPVTMAGAVLTPSMADNPDRFLAVGSIGWGHDSSVYRVHLLSHSSRLIAPLRMTGYGASVGRGDTIFLNPLTPSGTIDFTYQRPYASIPIDVYRGLTYKMSWNYYRFNETGNTSPFGLAAIQLQDFNGSNATFSFRYAF
jgi:hypothetical protein